jgi:hypothetical protein
MIRVFALDHRDRPAKCHAITVPQVEIEPVNFFTADYAHMEVALYCEIIGYV